jgi:ABC-2 type transport system ATP-binding protein
MGLTMDTKIILSVEGVHKSFDGTKAVEDVSFEVQKGEIFGLLGPNGAGKTTLIRMILGIFQPDSGEIRFSFSPDGRLLPARVGYLPEERGLYDNRRVCDTLVFLASLKGMDARLARERAFLWLQRLQLERYFHRPIRELSKGMQQKIQFIAAILHEPDFVILDEPFAGLDPVNQDVFRELIRELKARGTTILLSAHQMHLVEDLVDRIFLINKGRQILYGELREIKRNWKEDWVTLVFRGDGEILKNSPLVKSAQIEDGRAQLTLREGVRPEEFFAEISGKIEIEEIAIRKPPLHHIFVELVTSPLAPPRHGEGETSTLTPSPSPLRGRGEQRGEGGRGRGLGSKGGTMWTVARWEFVQNLKSKAFLIATFVAPIFSLSLIALVIVIARTAERSPETRLAVIDRAGVFAELSEQLRGSDYKIVLFNSSESELPARMQRGEFDGYLVIESDFFETRQARYVPKSRQTLGINIQELRSQGVPRPVREALSQILLRYELQQLGLPPSAQPSSAKGFRSLFKLLLKPQQSSFAPGSPSAWGL